MAVNSSSGFEHLGGGLPFDTAYYADIFNILYSEFRNSWSFSMYDYYCKNDATGFLSSRHFMVLLSPSRCIFHSRVKGALPCGWGLLRPAAAIFRHGGTHKQSRSSPGEWMVLYLSLPLMLQPHVCLRWCLLVLLLLLRASSLFQNASYTIFATIDQPLFR